MRHTIVTYTAKPGREQENAALVRAVFQELAQTRPAGFRYAVFQLRYSRQFVYLHTNEGAAAERCNSCRRSKRAWPRPRIATSNRAPSRSQSRSAITTHLRTLTVRRPPAGETPGGHTDTAGELSLHPPATRGADGATLRWLQTHATS